MSAQPSTEENSEDIYCHEVSGSFFFTIFVALDDVVVVSIHREVHKEHRGEGHVEHRVRQVDNDEDPELTPDYRWAPANLCAPCADAEFDVGRGCVAKADSSFGGFVHGDHVQDHAVCASFVSLYEEEVVLVLVRQSNV